MTCRQPGDDPGSPDFDDFFASEFAAVALIAGTTAGDPALGEDFAQEAFTRASDRWSELCTYDRPGAWVRRVAINLALTSRRQAKSEERALRLVGRDEVAPTPRVGDPEVWNVVDDLAPRQRAAIVLFYAEERTVAEIAELLDVTVSTATSHLHAARTALAARLNQEEDAR